ncbi:MAG: hypothetical protein M1835_002291 [Candelina submexicana]|nr:MAG: hypothetical protein M1835_002291 [Candelina submexicana]
MADYERIILNHYNITTPFPSEWPAEKDMSDASDEESAIKAKNKSPFRRSKSRYSALDRNVSGGRRSLVPGSQKTREGTDNLVQQDESDPLGGRDSVVRILRQRGLPVEDDTRLRNRFLLSSTTFSPALFLSQVHSEASTESLLKGLEFLSRSIDQKSASLKVLVESNFERFVRAKATIDNVYTEMRNQGTQSESHVRPSHSRQASRTGGHFRNVSGGRPTSSSGAGNNKPLPSDRKKNALTKESEYGVQGIKAPLIEVAVKAEEVWGPALGGRGRKESLRMVLDSIEKYRGVFEVGGKIADCIKRRDYETLVEEYRKARSYANDVRNVADTAIERRIRLTDAEVHEIIITGRMWVDVEEQVEEVKRDIWRKLVGAQASPSPKTSGSQPDPHMELISILLELGVQDNPIWVWLLSRYDHLKTKISATSERFKVEVEVLRRHLASGDPPIPKTIASHLRSPARRGLQEGAEAVDTAGVLELWELIYSSLRSLLATQGGLLSEVIEFWDTSQSFIDGKTQMTLPVGIDGQSRRHHTLSTDGTRDLQRGAIELVDLIQDSVFSFFADPPIEDISLLFSPLPPTPDTPTSATLPATTFKDSRLNLDVNNLPPPSPRTGEAWEKFAFWPPYSNSLSGVHYLSRLLVLIGSSASEMAVISSIGGGTQTVERLRSLVGAARERCVQAVCAAWAKDAENCKFLEDWTWSSEKRDRTRMLSQFMAFQINVLSGMQRILFMPDAISRSGSLEVVLPPPAKLLHLVRSQFVTSLYKAFSGMVENAEKSVKTMDDEWSQETLGHTGYLDSPQATAALNIDNANVRKLLTLSNLQALRTDIVQQLVQQFEANFSVKLTEEAKTIKDVLGQIDARLFKTYTSPTVQHLSATVKNGILSEQWAPTTNRPSEVRSYVYEALLSLVLVHTEVSTTAPSLIPTILSYLLEQTSLAFLESFKQRPRYSLAALMQATLDVELVAQTLNQYRTDKVGEVQSQIYYQLDKGTDNDARMGLQDELPEMRAILKKLREATRSEL